MIMVDEIEKLGENLPTEILALYSKLLHEMTNIAMEAKKAGFGASEVVSILPSAAATVMVHLTNEKVTIDIIIDMGQLIMVMSEEGTSH